MKDKCTCIPALSVAMLAIGSGMFIASTALADVRNQDLSNQSNGVTVSKARRTLQQVSNRQGQVKGAVRTRTASPLGTPQNGGVAGPCPNPNHDCFTTGDPGCSDAACCNTVCGIDAFCCTTAWDDLCVSEAIELCGAPAPANDDCANAQNIPSIPATIGYSNIGATTDGPSHDATCNFFSDPQISSDVWFNFVAPCTDLVTVELCGSVYDTDLAVYAGCTCPFTDADLVGCNDDTCSLQSQVVFSATQGQCYTVRVGGYSGAQGNGTLNIFCGAPVSPCDDPNNHPCDVTGGPGCNDPKCCNQVCAADPFCCDTEWDQLCVDAAAFCVPCTVANSCPAGAIDEGEPCGSDTNGGCNAPVPVYTEISCGDVVCGNFWASGGTRDTDWYRFSTNGGLIEWTVYTDYPAATFILADGCPPVLIAEGAGHCPKVATANLAAGNYVAFVATSGFDGLPCGTGVQNNYWAELSCPVPCPSDVDGDGSTGVSDLLIIINGWGPCQ